MNKIIQNKHKAKLFNYFFICFLGVIIQILIYFIFHNQLILLISSLIVIILSLISMSLLKNKISQFQNNCQICSVNSMNLIKIQLDLLTQIFSYDHEIYELSKNILNHTNIDRSLIDPNKLFKENLFQEIEKIISNMKQNQGNLKTFNNNLEIFKQIEFLNKKTVEINESISNSKNFFHDHLNELLDNYKNNYLNHETIASFYFYIEIITQFIYAFVDDTKALAEKFSNQIYDIRQNITQFINNIKKWESDFFDVQSNFSFEKVIKNYEMQNEQSNKVFKFIDENYLTFDKDLLDIIKVVEKILENASSIEDIAEKINILSINAAIESSRSDSGSKGFKVISSEIKSLANFVKSYITNILTLIQESNNTVTETLNNFKDSSTKLSTEIGKSKDQLNIFYDNLNFYHDNFNKMFESVTKLTKEITVHIDQFNILIQNYDIQEQQMINIGKILNHFDDSHSELLLNIVHSINPAKKKEILTDIFTFIKNTITTKTENQQLQNLMIKYDLDNLNQIKIDDKSIEFF